MKTEGIIMEEFGSKVFYLKIQMQNDQPSELLNQFQQNYQAATPNGYSTPGGPSGTP